MAKITIRKIGAELVMFIDAENYEERDIVKQFGRTDEKFVGKIVKSRAWYHPGLELRKEIL